MQISRLFEMLYILQDRGQITATELARRLEVSVRTVYRDAQALAEAGVPVYAQSGRGGGLRILPGYHLDRSLLSEGEHLPPRWRRWRRSAPRTARCCAS